MIFRLQTFGFPAKHPPMNIGPLFMGFILCIGIARNLITGSASADGKGLLRDADPLVFWLITGAAGGIACEMFYLGWQG